MAGNAPTSDLPAAIEGVPARGAVIAGKYVVERVLGSGGMGVVLAARDRELDKPVAIKMLLPKIEASTDAIARFLREAEASLSIQSEHVARVLEVSSIDSSAPYMVMEFLQGKNLAQILLARGPLPIPEAVAYVLEACEALAEAHGKGIIHRDLKPSNLFLTEGSDGAPLIKILDFGIAKIVEAESEERIKLTGTGVGMGSPQYMSPEQIRDARGVDARTDIWSLGVTLFELITEDLPFGATSFSALCAQIIADPPIRPRLFRPDTPPELEAIILRCLEKPVARRFATVADLANALLPFASTQSGPLVERISGIVQSSRTGELAVAGERPNAPRLALTSSALSTTVFGPNRRPSMLLFGVVGGAMALLAGAALFWMSRRPPAPPESVSPSVDAPAAPSLAASPVPASSLLAPLAASSALSASGSAPASVAAAPASPPPEAASSGLRPPSSCPGGRPCRKTPAPPTRRSPGATSAAAKGARDHDPLDDRK